MPDMKTKGIIANYVKQRTRIRVTTIGLLICGTLLIIIWLLTYFGSNIGTFTIAVDDRLHRYGIGISETEDGVYGDRLSTNSVKCSPVAYKDIDFTAIGECDGEYKSSKFLAYSFYIKNTGEMYTPVHVSLEILEHTKNIDTAIRVAYITQSMQSIYWKDGDNVIDPEDRTPYDQAHYFLSSKYIFVEDEDEFWPGEVRKYTIVIWVEGWDAQCIDEIIGGTIKLKLLYEVPRDENE